MYYKRLKVYFRVPKILEFENGAAFYRAVKFYTKEHIRFEILK